MLRSEALACGEGISKCSAGISIHHLYKRKEGRVQEEKEKSCGVSYKGLILTTDCLQWGAHTLTQPDTLPPDTGSLMQQLWLSGAGIPLYPLRNLRNLGRRVPKRAASRGKGNNV